MSVLPQLERDLTEVARRRLPADRREVTSRPTGRDAVGRGWPLGLGPVMAALSVAIAVGVAVIALGSLRAGGGPSLSIHASPHVTRYAEVSGLVAGVPQSETRLGSAGAPVKVTLYGDLECPECRKLVQSRGFAQFAATDLRSGTAEVTFRSLCTTTCDNRNLRLFETQQAAAYAAGGQHLFWQYALLFYLEQGNERANYVNARYLTDLADQVQGLNVRRWQAERRSAELIRRVRSEQAAASRAQVLGTPTLRFRGPKAVLTLAAANDSSGLERAVRAAGRGCPKHWAALGFAHCRDLV